MNGRTQHWDGVYTQKAADQVSWFQPEARVSLELFDACHLPLTAAIIDVGAGASTFVDGLVARGYSDITLLDISERALSVTRERLGRSELRYVAADITSWRAPRLFDLWHDRAVFHFLTDARDREAYRQVMATALPVGAQAIIGTFALDGPERCSGLPVQRYSAESLAAELQPVLRAVDSRSQRHVTPSGAEQAFVFVRFERVSA
jgi:SAM-dependent methyltransferase